MLLKEFYYQLWAGDWKHVTAWVDKLDECCAGLGLVYCAEVIPGFA